jgi:hypothetical protein
MDDTRIRIIDYGIEILIYAAFAVPMIFLGGVEPWARTFLHAIITILLLLFVIRSVLSGKFTVFGQQIYLPLLVLLGSLLLSTVLSVYINQSLRFLILLIDAIAVFLFSLSIERDKKHFERMMLVILAIGVLSSIYAVYKPLFSTGTGRGSFYVTGTFFNHNHFAAFIELLIFIPIFFVIIKKDYEPWKKYFLRGCLALFSLTLILSLSRGAIVSIFLTMLCLSLLRAKDKYKKALVGALFFCPFLAGSGSTIS